MMAVRAPVTLGSLLVLTLISQALWAGQSGNGDDTRPVLQVAGISASVSEDDPRVLYILPWQTPSLPRRPRAELNNLAPNLMEPSLPRSLENHRQFRETLNPLVLEPIMIGSDQGQP